MKPVKRARFIHHFGYFCLCRIISIFLQILGFCRRRCHRNINHLCGQDVMSWSHRMNKYAYVSSDIPCHLILRTIHKIHRHCDLHFSLRKSRRHRSKDRVARKHLCLNIKLAKKFLSEGLLSYHSSEIARGLNPTTCLLFSDTPLLHHFPQLSYTAPCPLFTMNL